MCLGPCTSQLHLSVQRQHGDLHCVDAIDHSKRIFSILGEGRNLDLEIALRGSARRSQVVTAQETAVAVARALHKYAARARDHRGPWGDPTTYRRLMATGVVDIEESAMAHVLSYNAPARASSPTKGRD